MTSGSFVTRLKMPLHGGNGVSDEPECQQRPLLAHSGLSYLLKSLA
jgi:hypothetical protein